MSNEVTISFILPVYNVANYLAQCLDSLIMQSINKEIILIDDGSTDASLFIAEQYAQKYSYIKVIKQRNAGASVARNMGIRTSCGKYIIFIDSDDYLVKNAIGDLCQLCEAKNLDMLQFRFIEYFEQQGEYIPRPMRQILLKDGDVYSAGDYFYKVRKQHEFDAMVWLRIYRRDFVIKNNLFFAEGVIFEDLLYTLQSLTVNPSARIMEVDKAIYMYRRRRSSVMTSYTVLEYINTTFCIYQKMLAYAYENSFPQPLKHTIYQYIYTRIIRIIAASRELSENECVGVYHMLTSDILKNTIRYRSCWQDYRRVCRFWLKKYWFHMRHELDLDRQQ